MQKQFIALAVAGLASSGALAQSNVTVYGLVDAGFAHYKSDGSKALSAVVLVSAARKTWAMA